MFCSECGAKDVSGSYCNSCGAKLNGTPAKPNSSAGLECSKCGSNDVAKASMLYKSGTLDTKSTTKGIGLSSSGFGFGLAKSKGKHQSLLAKELNPPTVPRIAWIPAYGLLCVFLYFIAKASNKDISVFLWNSFLVVAALELIVFVGNFISYTHKMGHWKKRWICNRCGTMFSV